MNKLPISIGMLAWKSGQTLVNTLHSYHLNGLLEMVNDVTIFFQETSEEDRTIANHFGVKYIESNVNVGIGKAFIELTKNAQTDKILFLEHDWKLIEDKETTYNRLSSGLELINDGFHLVKYRHRKTPGAPLFSQRPYQGNELNHYDSEMDLVSPHLLESIHWVNNPEVDFSEQIIKQGEYFTTTSRWGNWSNNPGLFDTQFYINTVEPFAGGGIDLEGKIGGWWARQDFKVAHGEGLFKHEDLKKFGQ
jgi:hypothetical protein